MKAFIFGANGQDGFYLNQLCVRKKIHVIGVSRSPGNWVQGNVSDFNFVENLIKKEQPDYIFHLAANSSTRHDALFENHETISTGTLNILESVRRHSPKSRVFLAGSGIQFKNNGLPVKETDEFEATSPYSIARIQSVYAARYFRRLGLKVYVGYLFHHESPLRKPTHVSQMIAMAVKRIVQGSSEKITLGDVSVRKEWAFAGDIAEGMFTLISQDKIFEACIGTGKAYSIQDWLEICFNTINKDWAEYVVLKESFLPEYKILVSDPSTIHSLGWLPRTSFEDLCTLMLK
ncbi:NAD-dependent epimerase/dehydratase [Methanoregula boonei 6A8]|uniref:GDP-mannose 4,6-dehydratase n=1 Tax=Methanoregula boonei (strain DSM 21154 / JCM 14090 / 6A8) TaxID=456442 RepID=A7I961_METB6|nr:GDP-mannose 4,6-dehydratase [Methanoregula boonei]ABS56272.1 NAD-dependent epimerase/dehydratase [Methanoregula boonei 6A8]